MHSLLYTMPSGISVTVKTSLLLSQFLLLTGAWKRWMTWPRLTLSKRQGQDLGLLTPSPVFFRRSTPILPTPNPSHGAASSQDGRVMVPALCLVLDPVTASTIVFPACILTQLNVNVVPWVFEDGDWGLLQFCLAASPNGLSNTYQMLSKYLVNSTLLLAQRTFRLWANSYVRRRLY